MLQQAGIDPAVLEGGRGSVSYGQMVDLVARAALQLQCPDFGMRLAKLQTATIDTPLLRVLQNSGTLGEAWQLVTSHSYAHSPSAAIWMRRLSAEETVMIGHDILVEGRADRRQAIEQVLLVSYLSCRAATGGHARARRVYFRHQPLAPVAIYRRYFGCEVRFGQAADAIVYGQHVLDCPISAADPLACHQTIADIDAAFPHRSRSLHASVRGLITHLLGGERCTNQGVAALMGLHPRALHRRLQQEGTSFQRILNGVRADWLAYYLDETDFSISEISERLGFAEQSALTRFCRHQLAVSPSVRRKQVKRSRVPH